MVEVGLDAEGALSRPWWARSFAEGDGVVCLLGECFGEGFSGFDGGGSAGVVTVE